VGVTYPSIVKLVDEDESCPGICPPWFDLWYEQRKYQLVRSLETKFEIITRTSIILSILTTWRHCQSCGRWRRSVVSTYLRKALLFSLFRLKLLEPIFAVDPRLGLFFFPIPEYDTGKVPRLATATDVTRLDSIVPKFQCLGRPHRLHSEHSNDIVV
jgi:hypothetical protein